MCQIHVTLQVLALFILSMACPVTVLAAQGSTPVCAIDMGSNTFRRIVGSFDNGRYTQRSLHKESLGVGDDLARHGKISETKLSEIRDVLSRFKTACARDGAQPVVAIGTAAFRDAPNGKDAVELAAGLGIRMEIATEARESQLAYLVGALGQDNIAVIDNGSRSIEVVSQSRGVPSYRVFTLGYRLAYDKFFAPADDPASATQAFRQQVRREAQNAPFMKGRSKLVGVEFGEMAEVFFPNAKLEGGILTAEELEKKVNEIAISGRAAFEALKKQKDIDRALPRLIVAATMVQAFVYPGLELTERELGTGLIIEAGMK
jgi:exopolyphosphatase/pppGpp-phosphohydrolase